MKLGIIGSPEAKTLVHAKELGLDFVEFDLNPSDFFGCPLDEITPKLGEIQAAMEETGVEIGAVGRWASHILDENGEVIEGLYVLGNIMGDITAVDYPINVAGNSHGRCITFGYMLGHDLAEA